MLVILSPPIFWIFRQILDWERNFRQFLGQIFTILGHFRPFLGQIFRQLFFSWPNFPPIIFLMHSPNLRPCSPLFPLWGWEFGGQFDFEGLCCVLLSFFLTYPAKPWLCTRRSYHCRPPPPPWSRRTPPVGRRWAAWPPPSSPLNLIQRLCTPWTCTRICAFKLSL